MGLQAKVIPDDGARANEGLMAEGAELKTALALSKMRLAKAAVTANALATAAALQTVEADYDGYPAGGITVTAVGDPFVDTDGEGVLVVVPSVQFNYVDGVGHVSNDIYAAWLEDASGKLRGMIEFNSPQPMAANSNSVAVSMTFRLKD